MKIVISHFGPIENSQIEFSRLLVFTGDSNLGKSYVNYLTYYLVHSTATDFLYENFFKSKLKGKSSIEVTLDAIQNILDNRVEQFMRDFLNAPDLVCDVHFDLLPEHPNHKYAVSYHEEELGNVQRLFETDRKEQGLFEIDRKAIEVEVNDYSFRTFSLIMEDLKSFFVAKAFSKKLQMDVFGSAIDQSMILPPARGAFVGENYTIKERISSSVGMYRMFLQDYDDITRPRWRPRRIANNRLMYNEQIEKLINGKLTSKDGVQYLTLSNGQNLPLSAAASSIKELSPLLYALQANPLAIQSFCIEEPEAHLHPQMQVAAVDLMANCYCNGKYFQFTTHSDYVIQRINQLIKLNYLKTLSIEKFDIICKRYKLTSRNCIDKKDVKLYFFKMSESGKVMIEDLEITDRGMPMATFFGIVDAMTRIEDDLDIAISEIQSEDGN